MIEDNTTLIDESEDNSSKSVRSSERRGSLRYKKEEKRKRAFSISKESTQTLELSLKKKRTGCRHLLLRTVSFLYAAYLMLFKQQSKPAKSGNYFIYFILALLISLDLLVSLSFAFHLSYPTLNISPTFGVYIMLYPAMPLLSPILGFASVSC